MEIQRKGLGLEKRDFLKREKEAENSKKGESENLNTRGS